MPASSNGNRHQPSLRHHLANRVRELRESRGWTQEDLEEQSGLHRTHVSLIERARCSVNLDNLERLADAFGVPVIDLLSAPIPRASALAGAGARDVARCAAVTL